MKRRNGKSRSRINSVLVLLAIVVSLTVVPANVTAKSLYVIADKGSITDTTQPVQAYNIEVDGTLTFQAEHHIPHRSLGAVGMAIDSDNGFLFITYDRSEEIQLLDAETMTDAGIITVPEASNLAGIVYDHEKRLLYCVDRGENVLYAYDWDPETTTLTHVPDSPFILWGASAYGIALDEIDDLLYVANGTQTVTVYNTSDWRRVDRIGLTRTAISIALDVARGLLYTGAGYAGDMYLTQYHLATGVEAEVQVEPDAGVMGLAVDLKTGFVYLDTGMNNAPGGDNLQVYDTKLNQIDLVYDIGNPTGLVVPARDISYNPLNLRKTLVRGSSDSIGSETPSVRAGATITYGIHFDNYNDFTATDVLVADTLPEEVSFVTADDDGVSGHYDPKTHTYEWLYSSLPPGTSTVLELTVQVQKDVELGTIMTNSVTINSDQTAPATTSLDVVAEHNALNLTQRISGAVEGQVAWVDVAGLVTYTICFDNRDNDFVVTDVSVVDYLPEQVRFVGLGEDTPSGKYDATEHTYTWSFPSLAPGETICLDVNVQVEKDVGADTTITNSVIIDSKETPPSMASVEAVTYQNPLNLSKRVAGSVDGEIPLVSANEIVTYEIHFSNMDSDSAAHNVTIIDVLPPEVSFVEAVDNGKAGQYDANTHTYTCFYGTLSPQIATYLELVVRVNEDAPSATVISNYVTIDSDETRPTTASVDVITSFKPLNLSKIVVGDVIGETAWIDPGDLVTYSICFSNDNEAAVTNVFIVDELPKEARFESAEGDADFGQYDPDSHTYTWSYTSLPPGSATCVTLVAQIDKEADPDQIMTNVVTIDSAETSPTTDTADVSTGESPSPAQSFSILPTIIRHAGRSYDIQATAILPVGVGKDDVDDVLLPVLYLPQPYGKISAHRQIVYGTATRAKVIALFDKATLVNAMPDRGEVTLTVVGKLTKGRSWYGRDTVYITGSVGR